MGLTVGTVLIAAALAGLVLLLRHREFRRSAVDLDRIAELPLLHRFTRLPRAGVPVIRLALLVLGVFALALASQSSGDEREQTRTEGRETVLVLDASNSMLATDVDPNRLQVQRDLASGLAMQLEGQIGVVYFAGRGYVLAPLTTDSRAVQMFVQAVQPAAVGLGGSALASGLTQAIDLLVSGEDGATKTVVLFSDGEETADRSHDEATQRARELGITVHSVGIGTVQGAQIPLTREASLDPTGVSRRRAGATVLQNSSGEPVTTRLEPAALQAMAEGTGGSYISASRGSAALEAAVVGARRRSLASPGNAGVLLLVIIAFAFLWSEGFALPRG